MTTVHKKAVQENDVRSSSAADVGVAGVPSDARRSYAAPRIEKRRAVSRVTLLSGGGMAMATGGVFGMM